MRRNRGQAMVEFALISPVLLLLLLIALDLGRGVFYYVQMADAAREAGRQAVLQYNQDSNTAAGACTQCIVPGVLPNITRLAAFGYPVAYSNSGGTATPPYSSSYAAAACTTQPCDQPGTLTLGSSATVNTVYAFIYELDPSTGAAIWAAPTSSTSPIRNGGHRKVVVDLKFKFQPFVFQFIGLGGTSILLDAQTVEREEY